jgi:hypothetical protein
LTNGSPLYIDERLMMMWSRTGTTVAQCQRCGYRYPEPFPLCLLCGGIPGEAGSWELRKAIGAILN